MAHQRKPSIADGQPKAPHSVSLKVLRVCRPRLAQQHPLPVPGPDSTLSVPVTPSLSLPPLSTQSSPTKTAKPEAGDAIGLSPHESNGSDTYYDHQFTLTPLLTFPPAFGSTYVGETFACTLSANNELADRKDGDGTEDEKEKERGHEAEKGGTRRNVVTGVRMTAEMQTPSNPSGIPLTFVSEARSRAQAPLGHVKEEAKEDDEKSTEAESDDRGDGERDVSSADLAPGESLQKTVTFDLREQGTHYLAVTITYNEHQHEEGGKGQVVGARVRSFRKVYQFVAQTLLGVRTKASEVVTGAGKEADGKKKGRKFALEAQIENLGGVTVVLDGASVHTKRPFVSRSLNWDAFPSLDDAEARCPVLNAHDVMQLAFLLEDGNDASVPAEGEKGETSVRHSAVANATKQPTVLGQLHVRWRGSMGEKGSLTTDWLTSQKA